MSLFKKIRKEETAKFVLEKASKIRQKVIILLTVMINLEMNTEDLLIPLPSLQLQHPVDRETEEAVLCRRIKTSSEHGS